MRLVLALVSFLIAVQTVYGWGADGDRIREERLRESTSRSERLRRFAEAEDRERLANEAVASDFQADPALAERRMDLERTSFLEAARAREDEERGRGRGRNGGEVDRSGRDDKPRSTSSSSSGASGAGAAADPPRAQELPSTPAVVVVPGGAPGASTRDEDEARRRSEEQDRAAKMPTEQAPDVKASKEKAQVNIDKKLKTFTCGAAELVDCAAKAPKEGFVFQPNGNPTLGAMLAGSCCITAASAPTKAVCSDCCDFQCPTNWSLKIPIPKDLGGKSASPEVCCVPGKTDTDKVQPIDVVIALDFSQSVLDTPVNVVAQLRFVEQVVKSMLTPDQKDRFRVGLLGFAGTTSWRSTLTADASKLALKVPIAELERDPRRAANALVDLTTMMMPGSGRNGARAQYPTFTAGALTEAHKELRSARARKDSRKIVVLVTDGNPWPQFAPPLEGLYKGRDNQVVKALEATRLLQDEKMGLVYVGLKTHDETLFPAFSGSDDPASGASLFGWAKGDQNRALAMCLFSRRYCAECAEKYGAIYADTQFDGGVDALSKVRTWPQDPYDKPFPAKDLSFALPVTPRLFKAQRMVKYKSATPKQGMTAAQYTDLCWRRMAEKWKALSSSKEDFELYNTASIPVENWSDFAKRIDLYAQKALVNVINAAERVDTKAVDAKLQDQAEKEKIGQSADTKIQEKKVSDGQKVIDKADSILKKVKGQKKKGRR